MGTSLFLKKLFYILVILYRIFRSFLPAASSALNASLSTNFLSSSLVILFLPHCPVLSIFSSAGHDVFWLGEVHLLLDSSPYFYFLPGLPWCRFLLSLFKSKDLLSRFLECLIKGVNVHLLFFLQDLEAIFRLPSKSLSDPIISPFIGIDLVALRCPLCALRNFTETTATSRLWSLATSAPL